MSSLDAFGRRRSCRKRGWSLIEDDYENGRKFARLNNSITVLHLPPELLQNIFSYLKFENISQIRLVCQAFNASCQSMLTVGIKFKMKKLENYLRNLEGQLPLRPSLRQIHPFYQSKVWLRQLLYYLDVLYTTYKRHSYYFIPGKIIDDSKRLLKMFSNFANNVSINVELEQLCDTVVLAKRHFLVKVLSKPGMHHWDIVSHVTASTMIHEQNERLFRLEKRQFEKQVGDMEKVLERQQKAFQVQEKIVESLRNKTEILKKDVSNKGKVLTNLGKLIKTQQASIVKLTKLVKDKDKYQKSNIFTSNKTSSLVVKLNARSENQLDINQTCEPKSKPSRKRGTKKV